MPDSRAWDGSERRNADYCSERICDQKSKDVHDKLEDIEKELRRRPVWQHYFILAALIFGSYSFTTYTYSTGSNVAKQDHDQVVVNTQRLKVIEDAVLRLEMLANKVDNLEIRMNDRFNELRSAIIGHDKHSQRYFEKGEKMNYRVPPYVQPSD